MSFWIREPYLKGSWSLTLTTFVKNNGRNTSWSLCIPGAWSLGERCREGYVDTYNLGRGLYGSICDNEALKSIFTDRCEDMH